MKDCIEWHLNRNNQGYGRVYVGRGKTKSGRMLAHRHAFLKAFGYLPPVVMHRCDNPPCINPEHLVAGTLKENSRDAIRKGRDARGERSGRAKLLNDDVRQIHVMKTRGIMQKHIAMFFGVSQGNISMIVNGKSRI